MWSLSVFLWALVEITAGLILVFHLSEHDDRTAPPYRGRKARGSQNKGRLYERPRRDRQRGNHSGGFGGPGPRSRLEEDGDVTMSDGSQDINSQHRLWVWHTWRQQQRSTFCCIVGVFKNWLVLCCITGSVPNCDFLDTGVNLICQG